MCKVNTPVTPAAIAEIPQKVLVMMSTLGEATKTMLDLQSGD
jgi:hypothetical protein